MDVEQQIVDTTGVVSWAKYNLHFPPLEAHVTLDDSDGEDNSGACFLCPFCYVDIEVRILCRHLEEEHCFDMKTAVCPVCAANFGRDLIAHLTVQHSHLLKRRRFRRLRSSTNGLAVLGKDLEKLLLFLGVASSKSRTNVRDPASEASASPHAPAIEGSQEASPDTIPRSSPNISTAERDTSTSDRRPLQNEEMIQRADFYQELMVSTIF